MVPPGGPGFACRCRAFPAPASALPLVLRPVIQPRPRPCAQGESARTARELSVGCNQSTGTGVRRARRSARPV